jgi:hypothetical protein
LQSIACRFSSRRIHTQLVRPVRGGPWLAMPLRWQAHPHPATRVADRAFDAVGVDRAAVQRAACDWFATALRRAALEG